MDTEQAIALLEANAKKIGDFLDLFDEAGNQGPGMSLANGITLLTMGVTILTTVGVSSRDIQAMLLTLALGTLSLDEDTLTKLDLEVN